jgi:plastocyanin
VTGSALAQPAVVIKMLDQPERFEPATLTVKVGQPVQWQNAGNTVHDATNDPALVANKADVAGPPGAKTFNSGFVLPGQTFQYTFTAPGTYRYVCVPHEAAGMKGEVTVK